MENACSVVNYFTNFNAVKNNGDNKKTKVVLKGASQGVDFITKMVGSTHGKDTRIKNADISLEINAPHFFQNAKKIVKRLINGVSDKENNNTIKNIKIINDMDKCKHPIKKTISLINNLRAKEKELSQNGKITLTIDDKLKETLKEYQNSHVNNNNSLNLEWLNNNLKDKNVFNT